MAFKKRIFILLLSFSFVLNAKEPVSEFCAEFGKDVDEYSLHLVKATEMHVKSQGKKIDSLICSNKNDVYFFSPNHFLPEYSLYAPKEPVRREVMGWCGGTHIDRSIDVECNNKKIEKIYLNSLNRDGLHFYKKNARETLVPYYGKNFNGKLEMTVADARVKYKKKFSAVIVGPCRPKRTFAEYCIGKNRFFYLVRETDYLPRDAFASYAECNSCNKDYEETVSTSVNYYGDKFVQIENLLSRGCEFYMMRSFVFPDKSFLDFESLYGKTLPVRMEASIKSGKSKRKELYEFNIFVTGPCEE